jgi:hypothetical protein
MDNYYKRPSPQELRYQDVLRAISALGPSGGELVDELDEVVRQLVIRAVDSALSDPNRKVDELLLDRINRPSASNGIDQASHTH